MSQQFPAPGQQPPPGYGYPPSPPPKKSSAGKIIGFSCLGIVGLIAVIGIAGALVSGASDDTAAKKPAGPSAAAGSSAAPQAQAPKPAGAEADVKITGCEVDSATNWAKAKLTITNTSSKKSNYMISVEFVNEAGTRMGEAIAGSNNLAPGQTAKETAQGLDQITGKITCKVTKVTRYAS